VIGADPLIADLIVNCTTVGMWPAVDESPWPAALALPRDAIVYDMIYRPARTRLMAQAEAAGLRAIGGLGMLVRQGAAAFALWTGQDAPLDVMFDAARAALVEER
jgi:shikimate dehydrogenase